MMKINRIWPWTHHWIGGTSPPCTRSWGHFHRCCLAAPLENVCQRESIEMAILRRNDFFLTTERPEMAQLGLTCKQGGSVGKLRWFPGDWKVPGFRCRSCSIVGSHKMATNSTQLQAEVNQSMILFVRALFKRRSSILLALSIYPIYVGYSTLSRICTFFLAWFLLDGNNFIFFHLISRYTCVRMYHCSILSYLGSF